MPAGRRRADDPVPEAASAVRTLLAELEATRNDYLTRVAETALLGLHGCFGRRGELRLIRDLEGSLATATMLDRRWAPHARRVRRARYRVAVVRATQTLSSGLSRLVCCRARG